MDIIQLLITFLAFGFVLAASAVGLVFFGYSIGLKSRPSKSNESGGWSEDTAPTELYQAAVPKPQDKPKRVLP